MPKWEARAKYSGCKAHFSGEECQHLLNWLALYRSGTNPSVCRADAAELCNKMGKAIRDLQVEYPDLLKDRTEEEEYSENNQEITLCLHKTPYECR